MCAFLKRQRDGEELEEIVVVKNGIGGCVDFIWKYSCSNLSGNVSIERTLVSEETWA